MVSSLILAAGKGTRMKSDLAKVLHEVFYVPMIYHVLDAVNTLSVDRTVVVVGHQKDRVEDSLQDYSVSFVEQREQLGTGHAVMCAREQLLKKPGTVLILCGDIPLIKPQTLSKMLEKHHATSFPLTVMTTKLEDPTNYGRIVCDSDGKVLRIVEEKDASPQEKMINEINAGIYCADTKFLFEALDQVGSDNSQGEIYLTDIVDIANKSGHLVNAFVAQEPLEVLGVNSRIELALAHKSMQQNRNEELMASGVTLIDPDSTYVRMQVSIENDTVIHPGVHISGDTKIGKHCIIEPYTQIIDCCIGDNVTIGPFCHLINCRLEPGEKVNSYTVRSGY